MISHTQSGAVGDMAHGPAVGPGGPQAPPRRPLRLRVDTRYAAGGAPPMDYRDDHLRRGEHEGGLACPYNQHEDAFGVVAQRAALEIRGDRLRLADYVGRQVFFQPIDPADPTPRRPPVGTATHGGMSA